MKARGSTAFFPLAFIFKMIKTIKDLEEEKEPSERATGYEIALKHMVLLIDEMQKQWISESLKELKKKIEG